jgi:Family of unknown function (DUF6338)
MIISADDAASTLAYLVPGFVALSVFYWFGVRIKRPDWLWLIWSLLATVPIAYAATWTAGLIGETTTNLAAGIAACGVIAAQGVSNAEAFEVALEQCASEAIAVHNAGWELLIGVIIAVIAGAIAIVLWRLAAARWPALSSRTELLAWQRALTRGRRWLEVKTKDGVYSGFNLQVANPAETDDLDLYLGKPAVLKDGGWVEMTGVEGMLIRRDDIEWIRVLAPPDQVQGDPGEVPTS